MGYFSSEREAASRTDTGLYRKYMRIGQKPSMVFALRAAKLPKNAPGIFVSTVLTKQSRKNSV